MRNLLTVIFAIWMSIQPLAMNSPVKTAAKASPSDASNVTVASAAGTFRFISWGDSQENNAGLAVTSNQAKSLNPAFTIFNGDLENDGVTQSRMDAMTGGFGSLLSETFLIRGNHDDHVSGSAGLWENYFTALNRPLPSGVTNYIGLNSNSTYLTYSFDYANSRFIGVDVPGDADLLTSAELTFMDNRLTDAENHGLTHAFIFWHGPEYCVESTHCGCTAKLDGSCTPSALITIFNKHPIVSATFHGHEHILGWVHMDSSRVPGITHPYEEFLTSSSTNYNSYNAYMYPARMDYYYPNVGNGSGFAAIDVNGDSFTFNIYKVGTTAPVWSRTFTKSGTVPTSTPVTSVPTGTSTKTKTSLPTFTSTKTRTSIPTASPTKTRTTLPTPRGSPAPANNFIFLPVIYRNSILHVSTPVPTLTATNAPTATATNTSRPVTTNTPTATATKTFTPVATNTPRPTATKTSTPAATNTPISGTRPLKYYFADRVLNNADYAKLAGWGINAAVVDMSINSSSSWNSVVTAATNAGIDIVIWPDQGGDVSGCGWETPFNSPQNGNYIWRITGMLDALGGNPHVIGIVIAHESEWNQGTCKTLISDMAAVKTQIKDYIFTKFGRTDFKIWNYIDNVSDIPSIDDYSGPADYAKIMDVAVTWQHCAGNAESACDTGSYSALSKITNDRKLLNAAGGNIDLLFLQDTFTTSGGYGTKFTLSQLENYSCEFLNTNALDGFGYYTWDAGWWPDLHSWTDLQPAVPYVYDTCVHPAP